MLLDALAGAAKGGRMSEERDYLLATTCQNPDALYICQKCGLCGRMFDINGDMVDDGGTTPEVYA